MKKLLSTAMVLGTLYGTANAAPITSPIYMPEAGKILSNINLGYELTKATKNEDMIDGDMSKNAVINLDGKIGVMDNLSINYGTRFDFLRKNEKEKNSADFTNYYFGVTGRVFEADANKVDLILNVGEGGVPYIEFGARYGLELNSYNLGFSVRGIYFNELKEDDILKAKDSFDAIFALENEFIFSEDFTMGLDLIYHIEGDDSIAGRPDLSSNVFGFNIDGNYALNANNFIGAYYGMDFDDDKDFKPVTYKFGLKFTSQF